MAGRASSLLNQLKPCVDTAMGIHESEFEVVKAFNKKFDTGEFGAGEIKDGEITAPNLAPGVSGRPPKRPAG